MSALHALYVAGVVTPITCGYSWEVPELTRLGTTQYTPYGPPWDDGVDASGQPQYRAQPSALTLTVGGASTQAAADAAELWTGRVLGTSRLYAPTGRFMRVLLARTLGKREPVRGTAWTLTFTLEYLDPYWHDFENDGSTRLHP